MNRKYLFCDMLYVVLIVKKSLDALMRILSKERSKNRASGKKFNKLIFKIFF